MPTFLIADAAGWSLVLDTGRAGEKALTLNITAEDLASALIALMAKHVSGVIHVTNRGDCTWHEFAEAIVREMKLAVPVAPISTEAAGRVAKRPRFSVLNQDRLVSLGIVMPEWRRSLAQFVNMQENGSFAGGGA